MQGQGGLTIEARQGGRKDKKNNHKQKEEKRAPRYVMYGFGPKRDDCRVVCLFVCGIWAKGARKVQPANKTTRNKTASWDGRPKRETPRDPDRFFVCFCYATRVLFCLCLVFCFVGFWLVGWWMLLCGHSLCPSPFPSHSQSGSLRVVFLVLLRYPI